MSPAARRYFYNLYIYKNFFTFQNMAYGATLAWLLFGITLADHARPVPAVAALGLLRGRGPLTGGTPGRDPAAADAARSGGSVATGPATAAGRRDSGVTGGGRSC